jgi:hypothetical protein
MAMDIGSLEPELKEQVFRLGIELKGLRNPRDSF